MKRLFPIVVSLAVLGPACGWAQQTVDERRPAAPDGIVEVENLAGSVEISGWDRAEVEVKGQLDRQVDRLDFDSDGKRTRIEVVLPRSMRHGGNADLTIHVPRGSWVKVETVSANITASDLGGRLELESVSGEITVSGEPSDLEATTVSGSIDVESAPGGAEVAAVSGDIEIRRARGRIEVENVSGDIIVLGGPLDGANLETVSGTIRLAATLGNGSYDLESMSGTITVVVPPGFAGDFELSTFSGAIDNAIGPPAERTSRYAPGKEVSFSTGAGGPRVRVNSFSGSVKLVTE
jgi:DUF4097 and DUF4098 domain-containing protein YvlB